jgi:hypothetical protein
MSALLLIVLVLLLLSGSERLGTLGRGLGRAARVFRETLAEDRKEPLPPALVVVQPAPPKLLPPAGPAASPAPNDTERS